MSDAVTHAVCRCHSALLPMPAIDLEQSQKFPRKPIYLERSWPSLGLPENCEMPLLIWVAIASCGTGSQKYGPPTPDSAVRTPYAHNPGRADLTLITQRTTPANNRVR